MKLWEEDFSGKLRKEVSEFTAGDDVLLDQHLVHYDVIGSIAHATMLQKIGVLTKDELDKLRKSMKHILKLNAEKKFKLSVDDEDVHTKVELHLTRELGEIGKKIHTARSRNDQIILDTRLYTKDRMLEVEEELLSLCAALIAFSRKSDIPMPGYTHLQKAMPSSVALWALAYAESLLDDLDLLKAAYALNDQCPLGSAAGYGVPVAIDRQMTASLLGFGKVQNNVLYVQNSRGKIESVVLGALSQVMLDLTKMANDVILFSTDEFGFFEIPEEYCTGSSIMPKKRNPDILELIRARSNKVFAYYHQTIGIIKDLPSGYNRDFQETKEPLIKGLETTKSCLQMATMLMKDLKVNKEKLMKSFTPEIFAADKAFELVSRGVPFRDAYKEVEYNFIALEKSNPDRTIRTRKHLGAPGNLGIDKVEKWLQKEQSSLQQERSRFASRVQALVA
ncbi:MAG: argininosuccinate lyase [Candidatus Aenigmarchaeota archaeon]|nr:argininosuccinate lyase [Candidatus Aenigmarchaeota archaeon]